MIRCANTGRDFDKGDGDAAHEVLYSLSQRRSRRNWVAHRERLWRHFSHSAQRSCRGTLRGPAPAWAPVPSVASAASERKRDANPVPVDEPDSELAVLVFANDARTIGNTSTEVAKYYLQLHYGIKQDYRLPQLLRRGNFYGD